MPQYLWLFICVSRGREGGRKLIFFSASRTDGAVELSATNTPPANCVPLPPPAPPLPTVRLGGHWLRFRHRCVANGGSERRRRGRIIANHRCALFSSTSVRPRRGRRHPGALVGRRRLSTGADISRNFADIGPAAGSRCAQRTFAGALNCERTRVGGGSPLFCCRGSALFCP